MLDRNQYQHGNWRLLSLCFLGGIVLVAAFQSGCNEKTTILDGLPYRGIAGWVVDSTTNEPLDSATVVVIDTTNPEWTATTDSAGHYQLPTPELGRNVAYCQKEGYRTAMIILMLTDGDYVLDSVNFSLTPE